jgi:hypothetical protein
VNGDRPTGQVEAYGLRRTGEVDADEVPQDDVVVAVICSAMALTMSGLVVLLFLWR